MLPLQTRRDLSLLGIAVAAMSLLGVAAFCTMVGSAPTSLDAVAVILMYPAPIGAFVGVTSSPVVLVCLRRKKLRFALPFVYLPSLALVVFYVSLKPSGILPEDWALSAAIPAFISVCLLSVLALPALPVDPRLQAFRCPKCAYDLRASISAHCPECGWKGHGASAGGVA